jgi:hypothetical protein
MSPISAVCAACVDGWISAQETSMATQFFRHRDADYANWRSAHLDGIIVNVVESDPTATRIHKASCHTLQIPIDKRQSLTVPYSKVCSTDQAELRRETANPRSCAHCSP